MQLEFCGFNQWVSKAERRISCSLAPYAVKDITGRRIEITPSLSLHHDLLVLGGNWIPVRPDGVATIEQMIHTPGLYLPKAHNIKHIDGHYVCTVASIRDFPGDAVLVGGSPNYYHWLIDYVPRLMLAAEHADISRRKLIVNQDLQPFQLESLALLGIHEEQLLRVGMDEALRAATTLVPSLLAQTTVPHPHVPEMLRAAFRRTRVSGQERIYLSRQDAKSRVLSNEPELMDLLERHGFKRYVPGSMTFQDQVDVCAGANLIVALHGAALSNIVFCPSGAKIFEICSPKHRITFMYLLAKTCGHTHDFVPARNVAFGPGDNPMAGLWEVDLGAMAAALQAAS